VGRRIAAVDAYIRRAQPFARPILAHVRDVVHAGCPEVEEAIKWSMPHFLYQGMFCYMAAFKAHAGFGFYKHESLAKDPRAPAGMSRESMGSFGRLTALDELPPRRVLVALVRLARKLSDGRAMAPGRTGPAPRKPVRAPAALLAALKRNRAALATWKGFTPGRRREYAEWIAEAKTDATRAKRLATAIEWMAEGKARNWKYGRK